ncbi:MAG: ATP-binding cassette domain-containing protein [Corynebacterium sp.]|uniref:ABC transporter ATP-binding protein/permease n=1 Tax=Corynebacterium sp. TaxID=1720 RepID=UPI0026DD32F3|nr:ATP-binding cassette domain-containing protein [Corynebacterium sp.]MDO5099919.1 ATP-binding cassette domain-containing protein [Corynebacterium sp.]
MKLRQRKAASSSAARPAVPYRLSNLAVVTIVLNVVLTWCAVGGMCLTFIGAGKIIDAYPGDYPVTLIIAGPVLVFLAVLLRTIIEARGQISEECRIRHRIVDAVFGAGPAHMATTRTGAVVSLATESSEKMMALRVKFVAQVISSLSAPLLVIATVAVAISVKIALVLLAMLPIVPLLIGAFRKVVSKVSSGSQDARKALAAAYMNALQSLSTLQLLGAAGRVADQLAETGEKNRVAVMKLLRGNQLILFVMDSAFSLALVTMTAGLAMWNAANGTITTGQAIALVGLSILLLEPMDQVGAFFYVGMSGLGAQRGIFAFLRKRTTTTNDEVRPSRKVDVKNADGSEPVVIVDNVDFGYEQPVLRGANLNIYPGERVAIVGRSGQGKSTLLSLIKGALQPTEGTVEVAGASGTALAAASASVMQTTWLFSGTIADNLRIARPDATETDMWQALERALVADEIRRLPDGIDTVLGEQGLGLSGGQVQRLSLARAIISGRKIVLLDEPTSHVDLVSERKILNAIDDLGRDYTLIMVTHRLGALAGMDRVVEVDNGEIKERA